MLNTLANPRRTSSFVVCMCSSLDGKEMLANGNRPETSKKTNRKNYSRETKDKRRSANNSIVPSQTDRGKIETDRKRYEPVLERRCIWVFGLEFVLLPALEADLVLVGCATAMLT